MWQGCEQSDLRSKNNKDIRQIAWNAWKNGVS